MKPKTKSILLVLLVAAILLGATLGASALANWLSTNPNSATIPSSVAIQMTMNGTAFPQNTAIPWGTVTNGSTYTTTFTFRNIGNAPAAITYTAAMPTGWTSTFNLQNRILAVGEQVSGDVTLVVPASAGPGDYSWSTTFQATQT